MLLRQLLTIITGVIFLDAASTEPKANTTLCEVESCVIMPTDCGSRTECQGCGTLCFGTDPSDKRYDLYADATGLSLQEGATSVWDGTLAGRGGSAPLDGLQRSADVVISWADVEQRKGVYDWSSLDGAIDRAAANNGSLMMLLWAGAKWAPAWLYDHGVEKVATSDDGKNAVPNYLNPKFQTFLKAVHSDLARELRAKRPASKAFIALQPCLGSTGDDTPFHAGDYPANVNKDLEAQIRSAWPYFFRNMSFWLHNDAFAEEINANEMVLLLNGILNEDSSFPAPWVKENLPGSFVKLGQASHAFQTNYERYRMAIAADIMYDLQKGRPIRVRGELSGETCWVYSDRGTICSPPQKMPWGFYAMTNFIATVHLDFWNVQPAAAAGIVNDTTWSPMWRLLNRYAGVRWARQSPGAWIAFRDGLDAMDTERFSEKQYGALTVHQAADVSYPEVGRRQSNVARALAICNAHSKQGCKIEVEDEDVLIGGPMNQRRAKGVNDVAFGNWRGDYGGFMRLIKPEDNTKGWWRVGSEKEMYGRFARGFSESTNSNAVVALELDRGLWGGLPLSASKRLAMRLLFFDEGTGKFTVHYRSQSGSKQLAKVQKRNSGSWHELCATILDGKFDKQGPQGADIWLQNSDTEDDVFGAMEIADASSEAIALQKCDWHAYSVQIV